MGSLSCDGYDIFVGAGAIEYGARHFLKSFAATRFVVVTDTNVKSLFGDYLDAALTEVITGLAALKSSTCRVYLDGPSIILSLRLASRAKHDAPRSSLKIF